MIFIHRLGIVFYWVGYVLAILFAIWSLLIALNGLPAGRYRKPGSSPRLALFVGYGDGL